MKKYLTEFIGTAILIIFGTGVIFFTNSLLSSMEITYPFAFSAPIIALTFGLTVTVMYYCFSEISGCHINPAVSFAMLITKKLSFSEFCGYLLSQLLGALTGAALLVLILGTRHPLPVCSFGDSTLMGINSWQAVIVESLITFVFVYTFLIAQKKQKWAGVIIGASFTLVYCFALPLTSASANPARSIGPAVMNLIIDTGSIGVNQLWVFILAPLLGATFAAILHNNLNKD